ncbi:MAG: glycosyltransferase family 4 protein [Planctomycetota bacterium]|jgi:UDP-GlcNAc:undecaprenyl-phosphate GlcNAc-1-phosphate transferase
MAAPPVSTPDTKVAAAAEQIVGLELLNSYAHVFIAAFFVTLLATPIMGAIARSFGVVDEPDMRRKTHSYPVPYLGGIAVFLGLAVAIAVSATTTNTSLAEYRLVPMGVSIGMVVIMLTGLADDLWGLDPRFKIAGQLVAAAALALDNVGVLAASELLAPLFVELGDPLAQIGPLSLTKQFVYEWAGTALIAIFVLGGCNSANLIDGLDGLLAGVVAIVAVGLLAISLLVLDSGSLFQPEIAQLNSLAAARIVLCVALFGAMLGFLPHNFSPASIFLGDSGSLLVGYVCAVIILMLGEFGKTHLVFAGLIVFAVPIMDTVLAIIRRWLAGTSMSAADDQHMHHQLRRSLGSVRRAVVALYALTALFAFVGVTLAWAVTSTGLRVRIIYAATLVLFSFIGVTAVKAARRRQRDQASVAAARSQPAPDEEPAPPRDEPASGSSSHARTAHR